MDTITLSELGALLTSHDAVHVSLYMPAHPAGPDTRQDPIRLKNLLREAGERLLAKGMRSPDVRDLLAPAHRLLETPGFWRRQSRGLALFLTKGSFHSFRLPLAFETLAVVSGRFHLKPLLPLFTGDGHFYILALSQNQVRLLEGARFEVGEVDPESMPASMAEALQIEPVDRQLQFHSAAAPGTGGHTAIFHGHDSTDESKDRLLQWFRKIDGELPGLITGGRAPLVVAGVDYLIPIYREANTYPHLLAEGLPGNPEELSAEELHARAWTVVQPYFASAQTEALAEYSRLTGSGRTTTDVKEAVLAAHEGRIDSLFVAVGVQVWGRFDSMTATVAIRQEPEPGDEDLLDLAAVLTILNRGTVYAVTPDQVPDGALLAAVCRY